MDTPINAENPATQDDPWVELTIQLRAECFYGQVAARDYKFGMTKGDFHRLIWGITSTVEEMALEVIDMAATEPDEDREEEIE